MSAGRPVSAVRLMSAVKTSVSNKTLTCVSSKTSVSNKTLTCVSSKTCVSNNTMTSVSRKTCVRSWGGGVLDSGVYGRLNGRTEADPGLIGDVQSWMLSTCPFICACRSVLQPSLTQALQPSPTQHTKEVWSPVTL